MHASAIECWIAVMGGECKNGMEISHHDRFFVRYAGCLLKRYGPPVRIPRWVRFEKRTPNATVASEYVASKAMMTTAQTPRTIGPPPSHPPNEPSPPYDTYCFSIRLKNGW